VKISFSLSLSLLDGARLARLNRQHIPTPVQSPAPKASEPDALQSLRSFSFALPAFFRGQGMKIELAKAECFVYRAAFLFPVEGRSGADAPGFELAKTA